MRNNLILFCFGLACCLSASQAAVFRRGDKISDNFKQLHLTPEEIDPNVAPSGPNRIEIIEETTDEIFNVNNENELVDESENEIIDDTANDIPQSSVVTEATLGTTTVSPVTVAAPVETSTPVKTEEEPTGLAKYCKCEGSHCDCCRTFNLPFIPVKGPGCARMSYLGNEKMSISLKYGDLTLASRTISSRRARPICVGLPGGYSQFCGRVYGLSKAKENFKACLGFELKADDEVEAAMRVSCFKFGPEGLRVAEAEPLPVETNKEEEDDDDDIFGFGAGGDDDDDDDYDDDEEEAEDDTESDSDTDYNDDEADEEEAPADVDYGGFSLGGLLDELEDDDEEDSKPSSTPALSSLATLEVSEAVTRTASDTIQSKDDKESVALPATTVESAETVAPEALATAAVNTVAEPVTSVPDSTPNTTAKTRKSKKTKKNKKKKAAESEGDFAFELLNGLLDFFN